MKIFCTGASGYIGGSVATALMASGHHVRGLVRSAESAEKVRALGIEPVIGTLDDAAILAQEAKAADAVINAASADHRGAAIALLDALAGSGKAFIHTSGSSIVGTRSAGQRVDDVFDETTPFTPSPARAARVALDKEILSYASKGVRTAIVCPSLIYGQGLGAKADSVQVPWLIRTARKHGVAKHYGPGENVWSNVHIDDLVDLYLRVLDAAPAGAFYFAENGENSMREVCAAISRLLGFDGTTKAMSLEEAAAEWGDGPAQDTMGSNSRVRAARARKELGWAPRARSLLDEIAQGSPLRS
ncbi:MAG: NAD-dependent epimerase/dehydratase family protein [Hyphomicrobium sp.]|nr:NAD-dependent epimerase/dehydratase family protein [Hyphomicrobium sp.]